MGMLNNPSDGPVTGKHPVFATAINPTSKHKEAGTSFLNITRSSFETKIYLKDVIEIKFAELSGFSFYYGNYFEASWHEC